MADHEKRYAVTVYVAAAGTPLMAGGTSFGGHMYYSIDDGATVKSYGFSPVKHGAASGPGRVSFNEVDTYKDPYYSRTMEVSKEQYEKLEDFGANPAKSGFNMHYNGADNSCIDFTWDALNHAGLHRMTKKGVDKVFEGALRPAENVDDVRSIPAPMPKSELNKEHINPKPDQQWWQKMIGEAQPGNHTYPAEVTTIAASTSSQDPLHRQAEESVSRLEQGLGCDYDDNSARLAASSAYLAKENGLSRIDHVVLSEETKSARQGENMFVVEGALNDPAHRMAHMKTNDAIAQPVEQSLAQLQSLSETQRLQQSQQHEQQREQSISPQHRMV
nr:XVIPCD domain-containing protein [Xanthomonas vasicola]MDO6949005.1 hypothetical protein [Xanthomonas vasicola]MDO6961012.1 hypothetical protein [Xanthomonas vasicola]MDO6969807.1 hypothetical protein [Xanthomonas vasicola]